MLKEEFNRTGPVLHLLLRNTQALITQMAQTAVCNRHHSLDQQLCRWLPYFSPEPQAQARHIGRRLRRRWPEVRIVLALWNAPPELLEEDAFKALGADAVVTSISQAVIRFAALAGFGLSEGFMPAVIPEADAERLDALRASGALDTRARLLFDTAAKREADIFDVPMAMVSLIDESAQEIRGAFGGLPASVEASGEARAVLAEDLNVPRSLSLCGHVVANANTLVIPDIGRDLRFASNPVLQAKGLRFYAGPPLRDGAGHVLGMLCLLDVMPRSLSKREVRLLEEMARDVMEALRAAVVQWSDAALAPLAPSASPSAIVGQLRPTASMSSRPTLVAVARGDRQRTAQAGRQGMGALRRA